MFPYVLKILGETRKFHKRLLLFSSSSKFIHHLITFYINWLFVIICCFEFKIIIEFIIVLLIMVALSLNSVAENSIQHFMLRYLVHFMECFHSTADEGVWSGGKDLVYQKLGFDPKLS